MSKKPIETSFLEWKPAVTAEEIFQQTVSFQFLYADKDDKLFWVENRPEEAGRAVIVYKDEKRQIVDVIPKPFSARSRVYEYGGMPYAVHEKDVYFVNLTDQRIYRTNLAQLTEPPRPLTTEKTLEGFFAKYSDLRVSSDGRWLVFTYELEIPGKEAKNAVAVIDLSVSVPQEARMIVDGADFYQKPQFSPDGKKVSWLEWNHPFMSWDSTRLFEAPFAGRNAVNGDKKLIAGSDDISISDSCYLDSGEIIFSQDFKGKNETSGKNFYNLNLFSKDQVRSVTTELFDIQQVRCSGNLVYAQAYKKGQAQVLIVEPKVSGGSFKAMDIEPVHFTAPIPSGNKFYVSGLLNKAPSQIMEINLDGTSKVIRKSSNQNLDPDNVSQGRMISFPTSDGGKCYGYFYPPANKNYLPKKGELPPVRVLIHGGPTAMTNLGFSKQQMFWTSQGYAIFDLNYRGSFGYGRKYRDELLKKWGVLEIQDVKDGLAELRKQGLVGTQAVVSGGSAGGYTVQRLLTEYPDLFAAGASYFGIGNLITLQKLTHKLESHYLEQLIGGTLNNNLKEYEFRSPIHHLEKMKSPMIIFQGAEDKVVPPENSREMAVILKKKGIRHEYHEYPEEGHGFRKKENLVDSRNKEALFFKSVLSSQNTRR